MTSPNEEILSFLSADEKVISIRASTRLSYENRMSVFNQTYGHSDQPTKEMLCRSINTLFRLMRYGERLELQLHNSECKFKLVKVQIISEQEEEVENVDDNGQPHHSPLNALNLLTSTFQPSSFTSSLVVTEQPSSSQPCLNQSRIHPAASTNPTMLPLSTRLRPPPAAAQSSLLLRSRRSTSPLPESSHQPRTFSSSTSDPLVLPLSHLSPGPHHPTSNVASSSRIALSLPLTQPPPEVENVDDNGQPRHSPLNALNLLTSIFQPSSFTSSLVVTEQPSSSQPSLNQSRIHPAASTNPTMLPLPTSRRPPPSAAQSSLLLRSGRSTSPLPESSHQPRTFSSAASDPLVLPLSHLSPGPHHSTSNVASSSGIALSLPLTQPPPEREGAITSLELRKRIEKINKDMRKKLFEFRKKKKELFGADAGLVLLAKLAVLIRLFLSELPLRNAPLVVEPQLIERGVSQLVGKNVPFNNDENLSHLYSIMDAQMQQFKLVHDASTIYIASAEDDEDIVGNLFSELRKLSANLKKLQRDKDNLEGQLNS